MAMEIFRRLTANHHDMATEQILFPLMSQLAWLPVYQLKYKKNNSFLNLLKLNVYNMHWIC